MPQDTVWIDNKGSFLVLQDASKIDTAILKQILKSTTNESDVTYTYVPKNSAHADSLFREITKNNVYKPHTAYDTEKAYYDKLGNVLEFAILIAAALLVVYAYRRAQKYKRNPFDEDQRDWIEIGSSARNNYGRSYDISQRNTPWNRHAPKPVREYLVYNGADLNFSQEQITTVLDKRFPYFTKLGVGERTRFLNRHKKFMKSKLFKIHDASGFKEMPILISATAIQLSFGLEEYLLPYYQNIHIFPQEFLGIHPTMRFLEGNVSANNINISWKHYLEGNENVADGKNVGLHEMAHAYYSQNFTFSGEKDSCFINGFATYNTCGNKVFEVNKIQNGKLFSDYAFKNFQEFWAESVEIFFEKPVTLKEEYPELYASMCSLLNQIPA
jgi:MtfA peptidase